MYLGKLKKNILIECFLLQYDDANKTILLELGKYQLFSSSTNKRLGHSFKSFVDIRHWKLLQSNLLIPKIEHFIIFGNTPKINQSKL